MTCAECVVLALVEGHAAKVLIGGATWTVVSTIADLGIALHNALAYGRGGPVWVVIQQSSGRQATAMGREVLKLLRGG